LGSNQARAQLIQALRRIPSDFLQENPHLHAQTLIYLAQLQREYRVTVEATEPLSMTTDEAREMIDRAIDLIKYFPGNYRQAERLVGRIYLAGANIAAEVFEESGETKEAGDAIRYLEQAQRAAQAYGDDRYLLAMIYREMCNLFTRIKDFDTAEDALQHGLSCLNDSTENAVDRELHWRAETLLLSQQHLLNY
jgi:hypothetical protein